LKRAPFLAEELLTCGYDRWPTGVIGGGSRGGDPIDGWESFALGQVGAAAALAGLVLVGVSVN
jgi:hypothetical protein